MRPEQKGSVKRLQSMFNRKREETDERSKTVRLPKAKTEGHKTRASLSIEGIAKRQPGLFIHWRRGMVGAFA